MTSPILPQVNQSVMYEDGVMTREWQEWFRGITDRSIGQLDRIKCTPASFVANEGTTSDSVSDVQVWGDGNVMNVAEVAGVPGFDVVFTFTGINRFSFVGVSAYYGGSSTHNCTIDLWNVTTSAWMTVFNFSSGPGQNYRFGDMPVANEFIGDYISAADEVKLRFYHPISGNASHDLYIDYVSLIA